MGNGNERAVMLASELRHELTRVTFPLNLAEHRVVRDIVCDYVCELRSLHWPPEQVIKMVKEIAHDVGFAPVHKHEALPRAGTDEDQLIADLVSWSITEYYNG